MFSEERIIYYVMERAREDNYSETIVRTQQRFPSISPLTIIEYVYSVYVLQGWRSARALSSPLRVEKREHLIKQNNQVISGTALTQTVPCRVPALKEYVIQISKEQHQAELRGPTSSMRERLKLKAS